MDSNYGAYANQNSSQRPLAIVLALASAVVLSPLRSYETSWSSGFVLPLVLLGLIIAIKTSSSCSSTSRDSAILSSDPSWVLKTGSSSWGLAGILMMLILGLSWQNSVQEFLWR
ncbi:unnamed protein product [Citrullus colocynthis]|uniref:Uncharacterized protein n=1 Tax=Citrullus colocynthis TaxID=252529 RepID=A0ABP0YXS9_9ROSI